MNHISIAAAFLAGLLSFLAPCVLPIIPGFLAYLAGSAGLSEAGKQRRAVFMNALFFVLGFSAVFAILGALLNSLLNAFAYDIQIWLSRVGGALIIFFGLYLLGLIRIPYLEREHKLAIKAGNKPRYVISFLFGLAFAAGWTPCVGPALGLILGLAATAPGSAFVLLLAYALGLGVPFLVISLFLGQAAALIERYGRTLNVVYKVFGALLVVLGVLVFTQELNRIASFEILNRFLLR